MKKVKWRGIGRHVVRGGRGGQQGLNVRLYILSTTQGCPAEKANGAENHLEAEGFFLGTKLIPCSSLDSLYQRGQSQRLPRATGIFQFSSPAAHLLVPL